MPEEAGEAKELSDLNEVYLAIISRYKEYIEDKESISVAELPRLVTPNDEAVSRKAGDIKTEFQDYFFDKDFYDAGMKAFEFVKDKVATVVLPVQFWLTPGETLGFMVGDLMDKNVLLCSLLIKLGNPSARVFVVSKGGDKRTFVYFEFGGKVHAMDLDDGTKEYSSRDAMIETLNLDDDTTAYEFNDKLYIDVS